MKNIIKYKIGFLSWVLWIMKRIQSNLNFNSLTVGETGCGKSWFDLSLAYAIDKDFEIRQVAFTFRQLMTILNSDWFNKKKWKIVIFEEIQCSISNRAWQGLINKLFNYLLSTYRHRNVILLMNSPYSDFIDSHSKKLIHTVFEVRGHNTKTGQTHVRPKILQYNSKLKKFYEHSLFVIKNGKVHKQVYLFVNKPPKHLIKPYEKAKMEFTTQLNKDIMKELEDYENKDKPQVERVALNPCSMQPDILRIAKKGYTKLADIRDTLAKERGRSVSLGQVGDNVVRMRKLGYDIRKYKIK